jgi:hypothetical protein
VGREKGPFFVVSSLVFVFVGIGVGRWVLYFASFARASSMLTATAARVSGVCSQLVMHCKLQVASEVGWGVFALA